MYKIAIVDDEKNIRNQILEYIKQYGAENSIQFEVVAFQDGQEVKEVNTEIFDIIFFDIDMPKINGMEAANYVREHNKDVVIVFITNLEQYAIAGYSVGALDYVLKPINYYGFSLRLARALERVKNKETTEILITNVDELIRLNSGDIYYIEIANRMLHYYTTDGEYVVRGTMKSAEEELKDYNFVKCNHWYLVNLKYVTGIRQNIVTVAGAELEISRRNKSAFIQAVTDYVGGGM